jgi:acyl-CoA carboxylase subunit beta
MLTDPHTFRERPIGTTVRDPIGFSDLRPYVKRLDEAAASSGEVEAAVFGTADIGGNSVALLAMEFGFMGGSMGAAVGEAVAGAAEYARTVRVPLVLVTASGGARMQEGVRSLLQMAKTSQAMAELHDAGVLSVCVLTDPTFGGVTASFATLGSILVAESGALVGFAGPRVIAETIRDQLPEGFQSAESLLRHGLVDRVEPRRALRPLLIRLLSLHASPQAAEKEPAGRAGAPLAREPLPGAAARDPWDVVRAAREVSRPTTLDYFGTTFDDFVELHGDRSFADDPAVVGGIARIGGRTVVVVGHQKGHNTSELVARNFGMPHPEGYRKALRLFRHAERIGLPVVTLIDTPGAYPGVAAEQRGQANAIADLIMRSSRLRVPIVSVVTGEGGSGGALALGTCDRMLMLENAYFSVISPEGCASILWRTARMAPLASRVLRITAADLLAEGLVDGVVAEPASGDAPDHACLALNLRQAIVETLDELTGQDVETLLRARHWRYRRIGCAEDVQQPAVVRP